MTPHQEAVLAAYQATIRFVRENSDEPGEAEILESNLASHIAGTRLMVCGGAEDETQTVGVISPIYASATLSKHVALLDTLVPAGWMSRCMFHRKGKRVHFLSRGDNPAEAFETREGTAESAWGEMLGRDPAWGRGTERALVSDLGNHCLDADAMASSWISGVEPVLRFSLREFAPKVVKKVLADAEKAVKGPAKNLLGSLSETATAMGLALFPRDILGVLEETGGARVGTLNALSQKATEGVDWQTALRNRMQAIKTAPILSPLICPGGLPADDRRRLIASLDKGTSLDEELKVLFPGVGTTQLRAMRKISADLVNAIGTQLTGEWINSVGSFLKDVPPERFPRSVEEWIVIGVLASGSETFKSLERYTGVESSKQWNMAAKNGWIPLVTQLSGLVDETPTSDPWVMATNALHYFHQIEGVCHEIRDLAKATRLVADGASLLNNELDDMRCAQSILSGKTYFKLQELRRFWRPLWDTYKGHGYQTKPLEDGCEWTLMAGLKDYDFMGARVSELGCQDDLKNMGDLSRSVGLCNCIYTYGDRCVHSGYRFFDFSLGDGRFDNVGERAALCVVVSEEGTHFDVHQFRAFRNAMPDQALSEIINSFVEAMRTGLIPVSMDCAREDMLRNNKLAQSEESKIRNKQALDVIKGNVEFLLPKNARGMDWLQFSKSDQLRQLMREVDARQAETKSETIVVKQEGFGYVSG